jgi:type IV pilus assembly protein PilB
MLLILLIPTGMQNVDRNIIALLPEPFIRQHRVLPLAVNGERLEIAVAGRPSAGLLRELAFVTGKKVIPIEVDGDFVDAQIAQHFSGREPSDVPGHEPVYTPNQNSRASVTAPEAAGRITISQGSTVQQADDLIAQAVQQQASDIHVEPYEHELRLRYRLDGVLHHVADLPLLQKDALVSRLKIMASLDIAEKRRPQDGRIRFSHRGRTVDLRVSTLPTDFGEKVVLRILDRGQVDLDLEKLGFDEKSLVTLRHAIHQPYGMVLVTGPTGSGKTTTLYAALRDLNTASVNISTIEDPIEYHLAGVNQAHVRADIGFTFAQALRAFLRQDPDVIMVGEIRDQETAEIAVRAALTGHLVLSTLHTNDAPSTITRLIDVGIEPFLVASAVRLVVAQRLVRRICIECKTADVPDEVLARQLGIEPSIPVTRGKGCPACNGTGYKGRTAIYESMPVSEPLAELISRRAPTAELRRLAREEGMRTLREVAVKKLGEGVTTPEEVLRETSLW